MNPISAFFVRNIVTVYFFYGLAFFALGMALLLASRRTSVFRFVRAIRPLAAFGLLHAAHEWLEMFQKIGALTSGYTPSLLEESIRAGLLVLSLVMLLAFGMMLLGAERMTWRSLAIPLLSCVAVLGVGLVALWRLLALSWSEVIGVTDALSRYVLGIPGALLGAWALMRQQRTFREYGMPQFGRDLVWAATAMLLYGVVGQIFVRETALAPSHYVNSTLFLQWFGIPVQLFRGVMAAGIALFLARAIRAFELESQRQLEEAVQAKVAAQEAQLQSERHNRQEIERLYGELQHREEMLGNLLRQAVGAQETERQRIARELHDATGQTLTAISLGLRGVANVLRHENSAAIAPMTELGNYATQALVELRQIIADLRPTHLDDLGLVPTLRWYLQKYQERRGVQTKLVVKGEQTRLPSEVETVLFRITQEALTNIAKHAEATLVTITATLTSPEVTLVITDNGRGFDPTQLQRADNVGGWGLLGMQERAALLGGRVDIRSAPGQGTSIAVHIPFLTEKVHDRQNSTPAG